DRRSRYAGPARITHRAGDARGHTRESTATRDEDRERGQHEGDVSKERTQRWSVSVQRPMQWGSGIQLSSGIPSVVHSPSLTRAFPRIRASDAAARFSGRPSVKIEPGLLVFRN